MAQTPRLRYPELAPDGVAAMSAVEHYVNTGSGLEPVLLEMVRLRCSLLNGCEYCIGLHSYELSKHNEPESRILAVAHWGESDAFTQRERAALRWAEVVTDIQDGHAADEEFAAVREHFSDVEVVNLTIGIASINAFNRLAISFRPVWRGRKPPVGDPVDPTQPESAATNRTQSELDDDGGKVSVEE